MARVDGLEVQIRRAGTCADFKGDDSVDIVDYAILSANYGLGGD